MMNEIFRPPVLPRTTQAAEGLPRRRWTTAELERMAELGLFRDASGRDERLELIGGEVVPMSPKGNRHEIVRNGLSCLLTMRTPPVARVAYEPQFNLTNEDYVIPDILLHSAETLVPYVRGPDALLVIEIGDWSLSYDLTVKAKLYAEHGVREYWAIAAETLETTVFRDPGKTGYSSTTQVPADAPLRSLLVPGLTVRLSEIRLT